MAWRLPDEPDLGAHMPVQVDGVPPPARTARGTPGMVLAHPVFAEPGGEVDRAAMLVPGAITGSVGRRIRVGHQALHPMGNGPPLDVTQQVTPGVLRGSLSQGQPPDLQVAPASYGR